MTLELIGISKSFQADNNRIKAVDGISLRVGAGQFVSIIGPSGCGKSTLFKIICRLTSPDEGQVFIKGTPEYTPGEVLSYMPQKDLLMPWRTVMENVLLPLEIRGENNKKGREQAKALFPLFGLEGFENCYPSDLSGGMSQRASLLRMVLADRDLMLLDEPFGSLDAITRFRMQQWLQEICMKLGKAILFITHDVEEAIFLSDRVYVMTPRPGRIKSVFEVCLSRPRNPSVVTGEEFVKLKEALMESLNF
ncbi:MAG: ABC transporter ATP-binding protein [Bacillota bacterium]